MIPSYMPIYLLETQSIRSRSSGNRSEGSPAQALKPTLTGKTRLVNCCLTENNGGREPTVDVTVMGELFSYAAGYTDGRVRVTAAAMRQ